jgi:hypothetical protein
MSLPSTRPGNGDELGAFGCVLTVSAGDLADEVGGLVRVGHGDALSS